MKRITVCFTCICMLLAALTVLAACAAAAPYAPLRPAFRTLTTDEKPLLPDFVRSGAKCWINNREVKAAENVFTWAKSEDGSNALCLMILVDAINDGGANKSLYIPKYGLPRIGRVRNLLNIIWKNPADPDDMIALDFPIGGGYMHVLENSLKGVKERREVNLPVAAYDIDGDMRFHYVPLYAILNEVGGGVMYDPLGDGAAFIYTGDALQGYSGVWEVSDDSEYRIDVEMGGVTVSVANYWWSLELRPDGTFTEIDRHFKGEGGWFRTEFKGKYAFFGRILAMKYTSESLYFGDDFNNLHPYKADAPFESKWGDTNDVYAEYVDEWKSADVLSIQGSRTLYSKELSGRKW